MRLDFLRCFASSSGATWRSWNDGNVRTWNIPATLPGLLTTSTSPLWSHFSRTSLASLPHWNQCCVCVETSLLCHWLQVWKLRLFLFFAVWKLSLQPLFKYSSRWCLGERWNWSHFSWHPPSVCSFPFFSSIPLDSGCNLPFQKRHSSERTFNYMQQQFALFACFCLSSSTFSLSSFWWIVWRWWITRKTAETKVLNSEKRC